MKNLIIIVFLLASFIVYSQSENDSVKVLNNTVQNEICLEKHFLMIDSALIIANRFIGTPYRYSGKTEKGFDCSGFVGYIFRHFNLILPPASRLMSNFGEEVDISEVRKGDLMLFKGRNASSNVIGHVALVAEVTEDGKIYIIHATTMQGVVLEYVWATDYYKKRYVKTRRIPVNCDLVLDF